jgi:hypothetical protein
MEDVEPAPPKKDVMLALLERAEARVHLDARHPGVVLPPRLIGERHLMLDYAYGFQPPIPDLVVDEQGISATLSFNRTPTRTFVPWEAVYLITDFDGNGAVWHEDVPPDLLAALEAPKPAKPDKPAQKPARPSHLKLVK